MSTLTVKKKVAIIEDDIFLSNLLTNRFKKVGIEIVKAFDGEEALEVIKKEKPDLILLDIIIPKKSGFEVMEELQDDPALRDIPIIIISNLGQEGDIERGRKLGAAAYFIKAQISIDEIISRVISFLTSGVI